MKKKEKYLVFFATLSAIFLACGIYTASATVDFTNPLTFTTVEGVLGSVLIALRQIIVTLAIIFIIIGAFFLLTSSGKPEGIERGKKAITMAVVGLAVGIGAPSILREISLILGWGGAIPPALTFSEIALNVLEFLLGVFGVISIIMLVIGAIMYLTSTGDESRIDTGKKIVTYSVIGIIVALGSMVIVRQIAAFFS